MYTAVQSCKQVKQNKNSQYNSSTVTTVFTKQKTTALLSQGNAKPIGDSSVAANRPHTSALQLQRFIASLTHSTSLKIIRLHKLTPSTHNMHNVWLLHQKVRHYTCTCYSQTELVFALIYPEYSFSIVSMQ